jgi:glycosyltransferase involved in cell wall biosynthesis
MEQESRKNRGAILRRRSRNVMRTIVIVCTYNRCQSLAKTLESVAKSTLPESVAWEVLVVDNNSTDQTRDVVEGFCRRIPGRFRYFFEPRAGKSYALNTGIREALGEILAFLDDDVVVEPTWLQNLTASLQEGDWAGSGGRTLPSATFSCPRWLPYAFGGILCAQFDLGNKPRQLDRPPYGTNMAFRREMFERYGGFRTDLGPRPNSQIRNEDTEFGRRLIAAGERLRYEPSAVVYHAVPEDRLKKEYFLAFWFDYGRATIRELVPRPDIWGIPRRYLTMMNHLLVIAPGKTLKWLFAFRPQGRFHAKCLVWGTAGQIVEIYHRWFIASGQERNPIPKI